MERIQEGMPLAEFEARFAQQPFEYINGEIREMAPTKKQHTMISRRVFGALYFFQHREETIEVFYETTYILKDISDWVGGSRVPDIMAYTKERFDKYEADNPDSDSKPFVLIPDFVVEIISPTDKYTEVSEKIDVYIGDGVKLIWVVDPKQKIVTVYTGDDTATIFRSGGTLTGGDVFADFELTVDAIFGLSSAS